MEGRWPAEPAVDWQKQVLECQQLPPPIAYVLEYPGQATVNHFETYANRVADQDVGVDQQPESLEEFYGQLGVIDEVGMLVYGEEHHFAGWVGTYRFQGEQPFSEADV